MSRPRLRVASLSGWTTFLGAMAWMAATGDPHLVHVATLIVVWALWGASLNFIWGIAGQFSLAQIGLGAVSAYTAALAVREWGMGGWTALALGLLAAVVASVAIGLASLRLSGFYFAIMTLAFSLLFVSIVRNTDVLGRSSGVGVRIDLGELSLAGLSWDLDSRSGGFLALLVVLLSIVLLVTGRIQRSRTGRALGMLREDPVLASSLGVRPASYRLLSFGLSAIPAGLAGVGYASYLRFIAPDFFGFSALVMLIVLVVMGGRGFRFGPVIGAAMYVSLTESVRAGGNYQDAVFGVVLIAVVLFAPKGIAGKWFEWHRRWVLHRRKADSSSQKHDRAEGHPAGEPANEGNGPATSTVAERVP